MTVFAIIPQPHENAPKLANAVTSMGAPVYLIDGGHGWLIATTGTAEELSKKLGVTSGTNGAAIIMEVAAYFGRANPNIWTWIKTNWEMPKNV